MQLAADVDAPDNNVAANWCDSRRPLDAEDGDLGSPGRGNHGCAPEPPVELDVYALQNGAHEGHPETGTSVRLVGVTVTAGDDRFIWVQEPDGGQFSGIFVSGGGFADLGVGDVVNVTGVYNERFGNSGVTAQVVERVGAGEAPAPAVVDVADLAPESAEPWEGVLVRVEDVTVSDAHPDDRAGVNEFILDGVLRVNDLFYAEDPEPILDTTYEAVVGPLNHSFGSFKIEPRSAEDLVGRIDADLECPSAPCNRAWEPDRQARPFPLVFDDDGLAEAMFEFGEGDATDWFAFTLDEAIDVTIAVESPDDAETCNGDPIFSVFGEDGSSIGGTDDDRDVCPAAAPRTHDFVRDLGPGSYVVGVGHFGAVEGFNWLRVQQVPRLDHNGVCTGMVARCGGEQYCPQGEAQACVDPTCGDGAREPGEECDDGNEADGDGCSAACTVEATDVGEGGDFEANVGEDEADLFELVVDDRVFVRAQTTALEGCPGDMFMRLYAEIDGAFELIDQDDDDGEGVCPLIEGVLEAGTYRFEVSGLGGRDIGDYTFRVEVMPVVADAEACDRAGDDNICEPGTFCLQDEVDGVGVCEALPAAVEIDEVEPNETRDDANAVAGRAVVSAGLTDEDAYDVYAYTIDADARVFVSTGGPLGCPGDTRLFRVDADVLGADGVVAAVGAALAENDDAGSLCSALAEDLGAGTHFYVVSYFDADTFDYQVLFDSIPVLPEGDRCDVTEFENVCAGGLICLDEDGDNDGLCDGL